MAPSLWEVWAVLALAVLAPPVCTALIASWVAKVLPRWRGVLVVGVSGPIAPTAIVIYAWVSPATRPNPHSLDGPAYVLAALLMLAGIALPLCLGAAWGGVMWRRKWRNGDRR